MLTLLLLILFAVLFFGALSGAVNAAFSWPVVVIAGIVLLVVLLR